MNVHKGRMILGLVGISAKIGHCIGNRLSAQVGIGRYLLVRYVQKSSDVLYGRSLTVTRWIVNDAI